MAQRFSEETQELLDRAQRAIDHAVEIREQTRRQLADAARKSFDFELALSIHERQNRKKK
jgi:hypothetical protein